MDLWDKLDIPVRAIYALRFTIYIPTLLRHHFCQKQLFWVDHSLGAEGVAKGVGYEAVAIHSGHFASEAAEEAVGGEGESRGFINGDGG